MDVQLTLTLAAVGLAVGYLLRAAWQTWRATRSGCSGGCGCARPVAREPAIIPPEQLVLRR